jgi:hypothetical protein
MINAVLGAIAGDPVIETWFSEDAEIESMPPFENALAEV